MTRKHKLAVLVSLSGEGGVERMVLNLVEAFAQVDGLEVQLVVLREESRHLRRLPASVRLVRLGVRHSLLAVPAISRYLRRERPDVLLAAKDRAGRAALLARRITGMDTPIYIRLGTNLSEAMQDKPAWQRWLRYAPMRRQYGAVDGVIAVSQGVADDVAGITGMPTERIHVVRNPVLTPDTLQSAAQPLEHPWFQPGQPPVILGMGRLTRQKDFPSLLKAFAQVRAQVEARLVILGEGRGRDALLALADELGVRADVDLPGFDPNPYRWLARTRLFVLSSAWEGSPNALTEALALGVPVVSTACPSGPDEVLQQGRFGPLVAVGDVPAMADAMLHTLQQPLPADTLKSAVVEYEAGTSARRYLQVMKLDVA